MKKFDIQVYSTNQVFINPDEVMQYHVDVSSKSGAKKVAKAFAKAPKEVLLELFYLKRREITLVKQVVKSLGGFVGDCGCSVYLH